MATVGAPRPPPAWRSCQEDPWDSESITPALRRMDAGLASWPPRNGSLSPAA